MPVKFIDNTEWEQSQLPEWTVNNWGMDQCRIQYQGQAPKLKAFLDTLDRWSTLPGYSLMRLAEWTANTSNKVFPTVELQYIGFRSGTIPPAKSIDGTSVQSASGQGIDTASGDDVTGTFVYRAARTSWTWFEKQIPPEAPRYATVRDMTDPLAPSRIVSYAIQDPQGNRIYTVPFSAFTAVFNSLIRRVVVADYQREEMIPGLIWACRSDVDFKVVN